MESPGESLQDIMDRMGRRIQERAREEAEAQEEAPPENNPQYRDPQAKDEQSDFFVPMLAEVATRDDMNLLDVSPYSLSKNVRTGEAAVIKYKLKDAEITIQGGALSGLATVFDYDIVLHMISHLNEEAEKWRKGEADKPPRYYRPSTYDILRFCRRGLGTRQYEELEDTCKRLNGTSIIIKNINGKRRGTEGFHLIAGFKIVSKTDKGKISTLEIGYPNWIYDGIVAKKPTLLALHPDYFLLSNPTARFLYRLARKAAGETKAHYTMRQLHERSGSTRKFKRFAFDMREIINASQKIPLPQYDFTYEKFSKNTVIHMVRRSDEEN